MMKPSRGRSCLQGDCKQSSYEQCVTRFPVAFLVRRTGPASVSTGQICILLSRDTGTRVLGSQLTWFARLLVIIELLLSINAPRSRQIKLVMAGAARLILVSAAAVFVSSHNITPPFLLITILALLGVKRRVLRQKRLFSRLGLNNRLPIFRRSVVISVSIVGLTTIFVNAGGTKLFL